MKKLLLVLALLSTIHITYDVAPAAACGGWWDPCCPWWEPERCAAFEAKKRQQAAENEAYFARQEERLRNLGRVLGLVPGGGPAAAAANAGADAARKAKEANAKVARGGAPASDAADYVDYGYEWPNQVANYDGTYVSIFGYWAADQAQKFTDCMQGGGESTCAGWKSNAQGWLWGMGWWLVHLANTIDIMTSEIQNIYGSADDTINETITELDDLAANSESRGTELMQ